MNFAVGQQAFITKKISDADVKIFSEISMDDNPIHLNEEYAGNSFFKRRIVHGFLTASLISAVLGTKLPGPGSIYLSQTLRFVKPVFIDDTITAKVTVTEFNTEKGKLFLSTECLNQLDEVVISGEAVIKIPT